MDVVSFEQHHTVAIDIYKASVALFRRGLWKCMTQTSDSMMLSSIHLSWLNTNQRYM